MRIRTRSILCGFVLSLLLLVASGAPTQTLHTAGQNIQPAFEGWERNPDGTFTLVFGYLNRNYLDQPHVPVGPNNHFEPGPADRGQPTHFYPRRQSFVFKVAVPADWGKQELVWTVTHNGRTSDAVGSLLPIWELDEGVWRANRGGGINGVRQGKDFTPNQRPSITVVNGDEIAITQAQTVILTVSARDDGQPGPQPESASRRRDVSRDLPRIGGAGRSGPYSQDMVDARAAAETGLAVTWLHYRGPGKVAFDPMVIPIKKENGKGATTARFSEPGTYVLRAVADDGSFTSAADVTVTVK